MVKEPISISVCIDRVARRMEAAGLHYGHGTDNARDEAAWLVLHVLGAPLDGSFQDWGRVVEPAARQEIERLASERCEGREPLAYLLGVAWFAGLEFEVSHDVLVPRSPMAELILDGCRPWVSPENVSFALDLCTGSGCIAVALVKCLPNAWIDASDISPEALQVAARNIARHGLQDRVSLIESDLFRSLPPRRYELILANPPYVPDAGGAALPEEYRNEPGLGLFSGPDGLDAVLSILLDAPRFLSEDGVLVCEVGESESALASALPRVPFLWLEFARGGSGVFVLTRQQLEEAAAAVAGQIGERKNVA